MLSELRIRNLAVIEEAAVSFGPGLNILSGETGAGKTIIMTALGLLAGMRASPELIRPGTKEAVIEGVFECEGEAGLPIDFDYVDQENARVLIVRRTIAESGRARVTINDHPATVQALGQIGAALVQVYGQHEQQLLQDRENHLAMLDRHAQLESELAEYERRYEQVRELEARRAELDRRERERADLLEIARFRVQELEHADPKMGEDEQLAGDRSLLANAAKLAAAGSAAEELIYSAEGAAVDSTAKAESRLTEAAALDSRVQPILDLIASARANLSEAAHGLRAYLAALEADPGRLDQIEARLNELMRLKRKYGGTISSMIETLERSRAEIAELENIGESRSAVEAELTKALAQLADRAKALTARRKRAAEDLSSRMGLELKTLGMRSAVFEARLIPEPAVAGFKYNELTLGPRGAESADFLFAANAGHPPMPLARVASGGELSRVMLALKRLEAQRRGVATLIFDEVDAGIGGAIAEVVGRKLRQLAKFHQVLCVTHLAQIAAFADQHFSVEKDERRGVTKSRVIALKVAERPSEIARMLGGDDSNDKFIRAARELINRATGA
jgi:DNA repair protein RecN (Recombination protein N)